VCPNVLSGRDEAISDRGLVRRVDPGLRSAGVRAASEQITQVQRRFIVVSGIPGSGKTTLARRLSPLLQLPVIDKDDILEALFTSKGIGDSAWRQTLSRESDDLLKSRASDSPGAILSSFWHLSGMAQESGTPAGWLTELGESLVHLHCMCPPEIAAQRFLLRTRHPGHLDHEKQLSSVVASLGAISQLPPLEIGPRIDVDTVTEPDVILIVHRIAEVFDTR
jgi:hypothetical protein